MKIKQFYIEGVDFIRQIYLHRRLIFELTKRDFKTQYADNIFGLSWAIVEPIAMMVILWLVFSFLRAGGSSDIPFHIYLLTGLIAYDFFNKCINQATRSIKSYSFLVKTVNFRIAVIPLIKIFSELAVHFIILGIVCGILILSGFYPNWYWFQILYYLFAQTLLVIGVSWFTASVLPFFPDITHIITITMRVLFFTTPIFWSFDTMSPTYAKIFSLNPLVYTVNGYRDSLVYQVPFWHHMNQTL